MSNVPLRSETRTRATVDDTELRVLFMGSINPGRLPLSVLEAAASVPEARLWVAGYETVGHPGFSKLLVNTAHTLGIEDRVQIKGFQSLHDLPDLIRECHVGLALFPLDTADVNERTSVGASNKAFQFLACEVPLLVPDTKDWREAFADRGVARTCLPGQAESVAEAFRWFAEHPDQAREMGRRGRELVLKSWNYEIEFEPVLRVLDGQGEAMITPEIP